MSIITSLECVIRILATKLLWHVTHKAHTQKTSYKNDNKYELGKGHFIKEYLGFELFDELYFHKYYQSDDDKCYDVH